MDKKVKDYASGTLGAGFGLVTTEFVSESVADAAGQTGYAKFGLKAVVKAGIGGLFAYAAYKVPGLWSMFFLVSAWAGFGSILIDLISAAYAGGVEGAASDFVSYLKGLSAGTSAAGKALARYEVRRVASTAAGAAGATPLVTR